MTYLSRAIPLLLAALLWEVAVRAGLISPFALPPLDQVAVALWSLIRDADFLHNAIASLWRAAAGLGLAIAVGSAMGVAMAVFRPAYIVFNPLLQMFYPIPKAALIPLVMILFGLGDQAKVFIIFLGCLLPVTVSAYNGVRGVDRLMIWSARGLGASRAAELWEIRLPAALPDLLAGVRTAVAFSFLLMVTSEFIIARDGLGFQIENFGEAGAYAAMFATILVVGAAGYAADRGFKRLSDRLLRWRAPA